MRTLHEPILTCDLYRSKDQGFLRQVDWEICMQPLRELQPPIHPQENAMTILCHETNPPNPWSKLFMPNA